MRVERSFNVIIPLIRISWFYVIDSLEAESICWFMLLACIFLAYIIHWRKDGPRAPQETKLLNMSSTAICIYRSIIQSNLLSSVMIMSSFNMPNSFILIAFRPLSMLLFWELIWLVRMPLVFLIFAQFLIILRVTTIALFMVISMVIFSNPPMSMMCSPIYIEE